ncbi:cyclic AMP-dependent protein kinase-like protein regulatory subunit [Phytophthora sojae]|uniref:Cyclic AMP-dependent protein kinase-like protein regulatory subunit n=1 Tax=Phytophthora sojae (strain P6497) TaxID=1094619 RepID=G4ZXD7_PHYSP|nr:cyclic AMP-dependent protein kinase-like protein regulatory subunit [Phytophthora sojae]EGZ12553.1 cyclic AMP-dependent protein kinase-like protein regulatory subunit [Phytophthora sojae]|eukprot:XP_009532886.1 cyclic AMP-dependent protein kinase-like protein regulatory subunit [Phytophthora sojae]
MPAKDCGEKLAPAADSKARDAADDDDLAAKKKRLKTQRADRKGADLSDSEDDETEEEDAPSSASDSDAEDREYSVDFGAITARLGGATSTHRRSVVSSFVPPPNEQWTPPVNPKSAQDADSIRRSVRRNLLFANIPEDTLQVLVDAMKYVAVDADVDVVTQGDVGGDRFFILDSGVCDVLVNDRVVGEVCATSPRNFFGELALLYDSPRAATVRAKTPVECWSLDRVTFKRVLMATTMQQRALYLDFLGQVPIFSTLSSYEKMTVADALRVQFVESGDTILTEGSRGDDFYIIADGEVKCTRGGEEVSARLGAGDFFGELALIHDDVRQATVTAMRKTKLLVLDRATFKRLLGPMQEHLRKRADLYELYMNAPRITEQN